MSFTVEATSKKSRARAGLLKTAHGVIQTPFFMPIATKAAVKGLEASDVEALGAEIILSNTYHLYLQPGTAFLKKIGGLHSFMNTSLPILTDSGGFQIFSLSKLRTLDDSGVTFQSHIDGSKHRLTPRSSVDIQLAIGSDIAMVLDYFPGYPATKKQSEASVSLTTRWAKECRTYKLALGKKKSSVKKQLQFGIVQGSTFKDLRKRSAQELVALDFDGYAVGGLAVGEPAAKMYDALDWTIPILPENKPRYLMGVGYPEQIVEAVRRGIDMFDCVIPTREGRHGRLFVWKNIKGKRAVRPSTGSGHNRPLVAEHVEALTGTFYETINIERSRFKNDTKPVDTTCDCPLCTKYSRAYLWHLFRTKDFLGQRLATMHNVRFYISLMSRIRDSIASSRI